MQPEHLSVPELENQRAVVPDGGFDVFFRRGRGRGRGRGPAANLRDSRFFPREYEVRIY